jgi:hypothetical protein
MSRICAACAHAEAETLNQLILAGSKLKDVALTYGLSPECVSRHSRKHVQLPEPPESGLEGEIRLWLDRANELYLLAGRDGDVKSLAVAITQGLRGLETAVRHRDDVKAEAAQELNHDVHTWDESDRVRFQAYLDWVMVKRDSSPATAAVPPVKEATTEPESAVAFPMTRVI